MPSWLWMILLQAALIALNALFAGSEIAILSVNERKLEKLSSQGNAKAKKLLNISRDPSRFLSTIQVAITLSGFLGSAFAADNFSGALAGWMASLGIGLPYETLDTIAVILITIILSYFTLVFGELVPKQIAIHKSEQMALGVSGLISSLSVVFSPLIHLLTWSTNAVLRLVGISSEKEEEEVSEEEIIMMVDAGAKSGKIEHQEGELIANVFEFNDLEAKDFLTHRTDMVTIDLKKPEEWKQIIYESPRSLIPVTDGSIDQIVGILNTKKYFRSTASDEKERIKDAMEEPYFVWESVKADDLFSSMKRRHQTMAIVLDEYGGVSGLVTLNDLIEQLVGDLEEDEKEITKLEDGSYRILGKTSVQDLSRVLGVPVDPDCGSLNGLIYELLQAVPKSGSRQPVFYQGWEIIPESIANHRVISAIVRPQPSEN